MIALTLRPGCWIDVSEVIGRLEHTPADGASYGANRCHQTAGGVKPGRRQGRVVRSGASVAERQSCMPRWFALT